MLLLLKAAGKPQIGIYNCHCPPPPPFPLPQELFYEDRHYHEHCFRCFRCDRSLADEPFTNQENALLCNDCYCNEFSSKCVACDKIVMPGERASAAAPFAQNIHREPAAGESRRTFY